LTTKTLEKLQAVEAFLNDYDGTASRREMAATFGLAIFASNVLSQSLGDVYWPMRYLRGLHADDGSWDSTAPAIDDDTLRGLRRWIATLVANKPVPIQPATRTQQEEETAPTIIVDASGWGWGAVCIDQGRTLVHQQKWSPADALKAVHSTFAEPTAALMAICRFKRPDWGTVKLVTDHKALCYVGQKGFGKAYVYNETVRKIKELFPTCSFHFVPGDKNPADGPSRGERLAPITVDRSILPTSNGKTGTHSHPEWWNTAVAPCRG
jgi:hypothetical protein